MITLDLNIFKEIVNNNKYNIISLNIDDEYILDDNDLHVQVVEAIKILTQNSSLDRFSSINDNAEVIPYLVKYYNELFKKYKHENVDLYYLFIFITISLSLSQFSKNSAYFLRYAVFSIDAFKPYTNDIIKYIESQDLRGLLFWICKKNNIDYDQLLDSDISYEYAPPKVTPQWLNEYRKDGEPMEFWFYNSLLGKSLFLVLYTPKCRYAKCSGCNLPDLSSQDKTTSPSAVFTQVDNVLQESISRGEKDSVKEIILSNNGNLFDIKTMPTLSLLYTINALIEELPELQKIIIESRIEYLNDHQLKTINEVLSAHEERNVQIEVALGFEIFDDEKRNGYYKKGFYKSHLEKLMPLFSKYDVSLKFYMMYKSIPQMSTAEAIIDINNAAQYASELETEHGVQINIHINPTYVAVGTDLEEEFKKGNYTPPGPHEINELCDELSLFDNISYYISLNDEGLSSTHIEDEYKLFLELKKKVDYFNVYQIFQLSNKGIFE